MKQETEHRPSLYPDRLDLLPAASHTLVQAPMWHAITVQEEESRLKTHKNEVPQATLIYENDISGSGNDVKHLHHTN